jgi:bifunctional enzyme CysN/CysC
VETFDGPIPEARSGDAVVLTTEDEVDISRGDMIVRRKNLPEVSDRFEAYLCWMSEEPMETGRPYLLIHSTRQLQAFVDKVEYRVDVDTLHRDVVSSLALNEIGRVEISTSRPLFFDSYRVNIATGSFVLVDPHSNVTVAAGMIRGEVRRIENLELPEAESVARPVSPDVVWEEWNVPREEREVRNGHRAGVLWLTGLSGAGKTTIAREVERRLFDRGIRTMLLDGDQVRHGLCGDLAFSPRERTENIRRAGEVAKLFFEHGNIVLCTFVSPYREGRKFVRGLFPEGRFLEVHVHAPLEELRRRDPKGLYQREAAGELGPLSGSRGPYEPPESAELDLDTSGIAVDAAVDRIIERLEAEGLIPRGS